MSKLNNNSYLNKYSLIVKRVFQQRIEFQYKNNRGSFCNIMVAFLFF